MSPTSFNILWVLCVLLLLAAFVLAIRRRRLAAKAEALAHEQHRNTVTFVRSTGQEVRIHMPRAENPTPQQSIPTTTLQPPPPAFDREEPPPPSYQDYRKDVLVQSPRNDE
ncbi:hypothetical protein INT48_009010 [Thamnidium elegans]|uniref:Uncharacterized protein n=1 Tax=Thamnidium elegans TaxID=101142 RepID=A0A8H7VZM1_9FUNG|nr:hypothetical protein INT48_009010 [Thamnidium elegans]